MPCSNQGYRMVIGTLALLYWYIIYLFTNPIFTFNLK